MASSANKLLSGAPSGFIRRVLRSPSLQDGNESDVQHGPGLWRIFRIFRLHEDWSISIIGLSGDRPSCLSEEDEGTAVTFASFRGHWLSAHPNQSRIKSLRSVLGKFSSTNLPGASDAAWWPRPGGSAHAPDSSIVDRLSGILYSLRCIYLKI